MDFSIPQIDLVDISEWEREEEGVLEHYPHGSLDKVTYRHEDRRYLFKHAWTRVKENYNDAVLHQIWVELIAFYVARQLGVEVPETALAVNYNNEDFSHGVLSKWFVQDNEKYILGSDFLHEKIANYDESWHNLTDILRCSEEYGIADGQLYWSEVLLFDCLIGNTDRHHENWGVIESGHSKRFTPAFDNGIALGFRKTEDQLTAVDLDEFLHGFKLKMSLEPGAAKPNIKQALRFIQPFGLNVAEFVNKLDIDELARNIEASQAEMNPQMDEEYRLSDVRKKFIIDFISHRKNHVIEHLNSC